MSRDLTGFQVGRLTVIGPAGPQHGPLPKVAGGWWVGRCACNREVVAPAEGFLSRRITSCGRSGPEDRADFEAQLAARQPPPRI
jgi:hypothetical protein